MVSPRLTITTLQVFRISFGGTLRTTGGGIGSGTSLATRFVLTRIGTVGGDILSQVAEGKSAGEWNITSIGMSVVGLPSLTTSFASSAFEYSANEGFGNSWNQLGLGGTKSTTQVAIETGVEGVLGTLNNIGNTNMGAGTSGLYRDLRLSFKPSVSKFGMTLLPATTSFGTNFLGNTIGNATQESRPPAPEVKQ